MSKILEYVKPYYKKIGLQFTVKSIGSLMDLLLPWLLSFIIDEIIPTGNINKVYLYGGFMVGCAIIAIIFNIIANRMAIGTSRLITKTIRHDLYEKILYLSCHNTDKYNIPSLIARLTTDTYHVHHMIDRMQRLGVRAPILLIGGILVTLTLEPVLALVLICILPILAIIVFLITKKGVLLYTDTQTAVDRMVRKVQESAVGIRIIKALSKTEYEKNQFDQVNTEVVDKDRRAGTLMALTGPTMNLLLNLGLTSVVIVGAYRVNAGYSQPGKIIAFLSYFTIILMALMMVTRLFVMYSKGAASAKRISEVLETEEDLIIEEPKQDSNEYHILFRNVCFSYNKVKHDLSNINFSLKRGQSLGIIGATGSGKSTIINLLLRFYDTDSGEILIDGRNIKSIPPKALHTKFGVVFQNDFLFADTIRENIDLGRSLSEDSILSAAKTAQADFIEQKENALNYRLTIKGSNLSGGQKQRLLISRALAANPEILLLDDSSSALDYITDAKLRRALKQKYSDTTTIIIAQRISSVINCDRIMVLEDGKICGLGTHDILLKSSELYKEMFETQMGDI